MRRPALAQRRRPLPLRLTALEDRCTPVNITNPLANNPGLDPTSGGGFTQSETTTLTFGRSGRSER